MTAAAPPQPRPAMSSGPNLPPERVPTLTEVLVLPLPPQRSAEPLPEVLAEPLTTPAGDEQALKERVCDDVQRQLERLLESRLREVLIPALSRAGEALLADLREQLATALPMLVTDAVEQELSRQRDAQERAES